MSIPSWDEYFLSMLDVVKTRSPDTQTQVAAIATKENRVISMGYNGFPSGIDNLPDVRPQKYPNMIHAEDNLVANAVGKLKGAKMYITHLPCNKCAKLIWNCGIKKWIVPKEYKAFTYPDDDYLCICILCEAGLKLKVGEVKVSKKYEEWRKQVGSKIFTKNTTEEDKQKKIGQIKKILGPETESLGVK